MRTSWQSALQGDYAWSSHPISVKVQKPEEIDEIFDAISYQKVRISRINIIAQVIIEMRAL